MCAVQCVACSAVRSHSLQCAGWSCSALCAAVCVGKALADAIMTGFGNDCFFQIIDQGREQFLKLLKFCQELQKRLRAGKVATAEEAMTPIDNLPTQLQETCKRLDACLSGLYHLLEALPDDPQGENGAALVKLWKYNGKGGTETLL